MSEIDFFMPAIERDRIMTDANWMIGMVGAALGLLGGLVGQYFSIRNTNSLRERAFMIKASVLFWIALALYLGLMIWLPAPYNQGSGALFFILVCFGTRFVIREQQRIRSQEANS